MPYQQITVGQMVTAAKVRLGSLAPAFYRDAEIKAYIQEAMRVWNACTGYWRVRVTIPTTAGDHWYSLPGSVTSSLKVTFNLKMVGYSSMHDLDCGQPNWEAETTATGGNVPDEPALWSPAGVTLIAIWPADAVGGNSLAVDGVAVTPVLGGDAAFVDIGSEELDDVLDYVQHLATFKEGGAEFLASQELFKSFLKGAAAANAMLKSGARFREWLGIHRDAESRRSFTSPERVGMR